MLLCWVSFILSLANMNLMPIVIMLSVIYAECRKYNPILGVIMLSVIYTEWDKYEPYAECYYAECHLCWVSFMLSAFMLSVVMLSIANMVLMISVSMLSVFMLSVVMLSVMAPFWNLQNRIVFVVSAIKSIQVSNPFPLPLKMQQNKLDCLPLESFCRISH